MVTVSDAVRALAHDLSRLFGARLKSVVTYAAAEGPRAPTPTLAVVERLSADDLRACASRVEAWQERGLATPLLLDEREFGNSLDAFPFEFGAILADHAVVSGTSPFDGMRVDPADVRRACEVQARSHLLHLREGYLETHGRSDLVARLLARSAGPLAALLENMARLEGRQASSDPAAAAAHVQTALGLGDGILGEVATLTRDQPPSGEQARGLFPRYLNALESLVHYVDRWGAA